MACIDATKPAFRFIILVLNCLLTFGSYFCFDMPSVLQERFQCNSSQINDSQHDCLDMSPESYNLLYAIYAWISAIIVIVAGFFIDKVGNQTGAFVFSSLCILGSSLFAAGSMMKGTPYIFPIMIIGRLLFGAGNGSLTIVRRRLSTFWFKDKELAMAFGVTLAFSRLGSVLNFLITVHVADRFGVMLTLWGGALLCAFGFVPALLVGILDKVGLKQLGLDSANSEDSKKLRFTDIKNFNIQYWLITLTIMFFYNGVFPFVADASKFIHDKYGYDQKQSAYMAGAVYYLSMVLLPVLGFAVDYIGKRGYLSLACAVLTTPVLVLLALTNIHPLVFTIWLGFMYSVAASSMWPSIPLVIKQSAVGTAMGLTSSLQMIGIGISNLCVGAILGSADQSTESLLTRWKFVMIFLLGNNILCIVVAVLLNIFDKTRDKVLNLSKYQKEMRKTLEEARASSHSIQHPMLDEPEETEPLLGRQDSRD